MAHVLLAPVLTGLSKKDLKVVEGSVALVKIKVQKSFNISKLVKHFCCFLLFIFSI